MLLDLLLYVNENLVNEDLIVDLVLIRIHLTVPLFYIVLKHLMDLDCYGIIGIIKGDQLVLRNTFTFLRILLFGILLSLVSLGLRLLLLIDLSNLGGQLLALGLFENFYDKLSSFLDHVLLNGQAIILIDPFFDIQKVFFNLLLHNL
jgi:hypothetical protein